LVEIVVDRGAPQDTGQSSFSWHCSVVAQFIIHSASTKLGSNAEDFASFLKISIHFMQISRKNGLRAPETVEGVEFPEMVALCDRWTI
jgi:hypothetical protein